MEIQGATGLDAYTSILYIWMGHGGNKLMSSLLESITHLSMHRLYPAQCVLLPASAADRCYDQAVAPRPPMSEEQPAKAFLEKVKSDTELQEKLKAAASPEAALQIAKEAGFSITAEDIQSMQSVEVSDKELEAAAGGTFLSMENWDVLSNDWCCRPLKD